MKLVMGDITRMETDAVVTPASTDLRPTEGICKAVFAASDAVKLMAACKKLGHCRIGHAVVTPSFGLKAKYIIHTAGSGWYSGRQNDRDVFRDCYRNALLKAAALGCRSVSIPLMFSGSMHIPRAEALKMVKNVVGDFERIYPDMEIYLVLWKESIYNLALHIMGMEK